MLKLRGINKYVLLLELQIVNEMLRVVALAGHRLNIRLMTQAL